MPMSIEQAVEIVTRLERGYDRQLDPEVKKEFVRHIRPLNYELAEKAAYEIVDRAGLKTEQYDLRYFPKPGVFRAIYHEVANEGYANAQGTRPSQGAKVTAYEMWRAHRISTLPEDEYWDYALDPAAQRRMDAVWKQEFAQAVRAS